MEDCCTLKRGAPTSPTHCPECGKPGRLVDRITVKAMLRPEALTRLSAPEHRFCPTPECPVVYFGLEEVFDREEIGVPVFQKEPAGERIVCYCFVVSEGDIRREMAEMGRSTAGDRIGALVKAERCACEVKNPQGSCCLGNVAAATKAAKAGRGGERIGTWREAVGQGRKARGACRGRGADGQRPRGYGAGGSGVKRP